MRSRWRGVFRLSGGPALIAMVQATNFRYRNNRTQFDRLSYRCFVTKGREAIPLFGERGLASQLGSVEYSRPRRFCQKLEQWLKMIRLLWPDCPAEINSSGDAPVVSRGSAVQAAERIGA